MAGLSGLIVEQQEREIWGRIQAAVAEERERCIDALGGYRGSRRKLTPSAIKEIRALKGKVTQQSLAERFGVSPATMRDIYRGKTWRHIS